MTNVTYSNGLYLRYNYDSSGRVSGINRQRRSSWISVVGAVSQKSGSDSIFIKALNAYATSYDPTKDPAPTLADECLLDPSVVSNWNKR